MTEINSENKATDWQSKECKCFEERTNEWLFESWIEGNVKYKTKHVD